MIRAVALVGMLAATVCGAQFASAASVVHFDVSGPTPSSHFDFDIAKTPTPTSSTGNSFTIADVTTMAFNTVYGFYSFQADYTFYLPDMTAGDSGGFSSTARGRFYGSQLFSGSTSAPVFELGDFYTYRPVNDDYADPFDVLVTNTSSPAVPEPASWALMITGFTAIGIAMRGRAKRMVAG